MRTEQIVILNKEDIRKLPYMLIYETYHLGSGKVNTGRAKRLLKESFTEQEIKYIDNIVKTCTKWVEKSAPSEYILNPEEYIVWQKLGMYCISL